MANAAERPSTQDHDDGPATPQRPSVARRSTASDHPLGNALVIAALVTSPLMWVIELIAPQWLIYVFRAGWVLLVAVAAAVIVRERRELRRRTGRPRPDRHPSPRR